MICALQRDVPILVILIAQVGVEDAQRLGAVGERHRGQWPVRPVSRARRRWTGSGGLPEVKVRVVFMPGLLPTSVSALRSELRSETMK